MRFHCYSPRSYRCLFGPSPVPCVRMFVFFFLGHPESKIPPSATSGLGAPDHGRGASLGWIYSWQDAGWRELLQVGFCSGTRFEKCSFLSFSPHAPSCHHYDYAVHKNQGQIIVFYTWFDVADVMGCLNLLGAQLIFGFFY